MKTITGLVLRLCVVCALCTTLAPRVLAQATGGACCLANGQCVVNTQCECEMQGGAWQGIGSGCPNTNCAATVFGVCCNPAGCIVTTASLCSASGGTVFQAGQTSCASAPCVGPTVACCCGSVCLVTNPRFCALVGSSIVGTTCTPGICPVVVCCDALAGCTLIAPNAPCNGIVLTTNTTCNPNPCPPASTNCCNVSTGVCSNFPGLGCPAGWFGNFSACAPTPCPPHFCCDVNNNCFIVYAPGSCNGQIIATITTCNPNPCPNAASLYACCDTLGNCTMVPLGTPCNGTVLTSATCVPTNPCPQPTNGACCTVNAAGATVCNIVSGPTACPAPGIWGGVGSTCVPVNPCVPPSTICCNIGTGICQIVSGISCPTGSIAVTATSCNPNPCPPGTQGACCTVNAAGVSVCTIVASAAACPPPGVWGGTGSTCVPANPCVPPSILCCDPTTGVCNIVPGTSCPVGTIPFSATSCNPNPCPPGSQGACCDPTNGICNIVSASTACVAPQVFYPGQTCAGITCPPSNNQICCDPATGACSTVPLGTPCPPGTVSTTFTSCSPNPCPPPTGGTGACCQPCTGTCFTVTAAQPCGGAFTFIAGATCTPNPCPTGPVYGKCCMNGNCIAATSCDCIKKAGTWLGNNPCNSTICAAEVPGACCNPSNNVCSYVSSGTCAQISGTNFTPYTVCSGAAPCNSPIVACCCCNTCTTLDPQVCTLAGGTILPGATSCTPLTCFPNGGACCNPSTGVCSIVAGPSACQPPLQYFPGQNCGQIVCGPNNGACCNVCTGNCIITVATQCVPPQNVFTLGVTCAQVGCTPTCGACCGVNTAGVYGCYMVQNAAACTNAGGIFQGVGTNCAGITCPPQTGACCGFNAAGVYGCYTVSSATACNGTFYGLGSTCAGIVCPPPVVVCCDPQGNCQIFTSFVCPVNYPTLVPGGTCNPNPCPTGACCGINAAGVYGCFPVPSATACNGTFYGIGSTCVGITCPPQSVVCCDPITGACSSVAGTVCPPGTIQVASSTCNPNPCPPGSQGACCDPATGLCSIQPDASHCPPPLIFALGLTCAQMPPCLVTPTQVCCDPATGACSTAIPCPFANGVVVSQTTCTPNPCRGACCGTNTAGVFGCFIANGPAFCNGQWLGYGVSCVGVTCPTMGACCTPCSGACTQTTAANCPGGGMYFPGATCAPGFCPAQVLFGKCCLNGQCTTASSCDCVNKFGTWYGPGGTCNPAQCAQEITGACCVTSTQICQQLTAGTCQQINGQFFPSQSCGNIPIQCAQPGSACCCCGACHMQDQATCLLSGGTWFPGVACNPYPCNGAPTTGACCIPGTTICQAPVTQANCQGVWFANGVCTPNPCVTACCDLSTGICTFIFASTACPTGTVPYPGSTCNPSPCPPLQVCCDPQTGACSTLVPCPFLNGVPLTTATSCLPNNPCPHIVCCDANGNCGLVATAAQCSGQIFPSLSSCLPNPCLPTGLCCTPQGCISAPSQCDCLTQYGGIWIANCNPAVCPTGTSTFFGACCIPNAAGLNTCVQTNANICSQLGGQFFSNQTCPLAGGCVSQPVACCCPTATGGGSCVMVDAALCNLAGGIPVSASSCTPINPCIPGHGACCDPATGICTNVSSATACPPTSIYTPNVTCANAPPCPPPTPGACCTACTGACTTVSTQAQCPSAGAFYPGATCQPNPCPAAGTQLFGTCCIFQNCTQTTPCECIAKEGVWYGPNQACNPATCQTEIQGACCNPSSNICSLAAPTTCATIGGNYGGPNSVCGTGGPFPNCANPAPACCCCGSCHDLDPALCLLGAGTTVYGTVCGPFTCNPGGACCDPATGNCTIVSSASQCPAPGLYYNSQLCSQIPPCLQQGACCNLMTGSCFSAPQTQCPPPLFTWTAGGSCLPPNPVVCPQTAGACCNYATGACTTVPNSAACPAPLVFLGIGAPCPSTPCIPPQVVCCDVTNGNCQIFLAINCPTGWIPSVASSCLSFVGGPQPCPPIGRCCIVGSVTCTTTIQALCNGNWVQGGTCTPNPCVTACCNHSTGACSQVYIGQTCPPGTSASPGQTCNTVFCFVVIPITTCCTATGGCTMVTGTSCPPGMTPASGLCGPFGGNPCPIYGACCHFQSPICTQTTQAQCNASGGIWGVISCTPNPCYGACCDTVYGGCIVDMIWKCFGMTYIPGVSCVPNPCPGACCNTQTGACSVLAQSACPAPNLYLGNGSACTGTVCHPGVCCYPNGQCVTVAAPSQCPSTAYFMPNLTTCNPYPCGGACCTLLFSTSGPPIVSCSYTSPLGCFFGQWQGPGTTCTPNPCPGVCCTNSGGCFVGPLFLCPSLGTFLAGGTTCSPNPCRGACCLPPNTSAYGNTTGTHCVITTISACPQGQWHGVGSACASPPASANLTTCCPANFDGMNGPQVADVFAFLSAWFNGCTGQAGPPCFGANADFNGGGLAVADVFAFLNAWFTGCS